MIRLENVGFNAGDVSINGVNFHLPRGQTAVILGSRMAGKSDFINLCLGKYPLTAGVIHLLGRAMSPDSDFIPADFRRISIVTQHVTLLDNLSVAGNVGLPLAYHEGMKDRDAWKRVMPLLRQLGIEKIADRFPHEINANESKMAMLARSVIRQPSLVIMDEPTAGDLDPVGFMQVMTAIRWFHEQGISMLITTCSPSMASLEWADFYYLVGHRLIPHSSQLETVDPAAREFFNEIRNYTQRQKTEISGFFKVLFKDGQTEKT